MLTSLIQNKHLHIHFYQLTWYLFAISLKTSSVFSNPYVTGIEKVIFIFVGSIFA